MPSFPRQLATAAVLALATVSTFSTSSVAADDTTSSIPHKQLKIVGGSAVQIGEFPFAANIHVRNLSACGGTIISDRWILTAAHCLVDPVASGNAGFNVKYDMSTIDLNIGHTSNATDSPFTIKQMISHPNYMYNSTYYDGGLIELTTPLTFSEDILPVKLVLDAGHFPTGQTFSVIGWGRNEADQKSPFLQRVDLPTVNETTCQQAHPEYAQHHDQLLCVGNSLGKDTCRGDSGGPLLVQATGADGTTGESAAEAWMQAGITSFGANALGLDANLCGVAGAVGYYARVDFLSSWIAATTGLSTKQFTAALPDSFQSSKADEADYAHMLSAAGTAPYRLLRSEKLVAPLTLIAASLLATAPSVLFG